MRNGSEVSNVSDELPFGDIGVRTHRWDDVPVDCCHQEGVEWTMVKGDPASPARVETCNPDVSVVSGVNRFTFCGLYIDAVMDFNEPVAGDASGPGDTECLIQATALDVAREW